MIRAILLALLISIAVPGKAEPADHSVLEVVSELIGAKKKRGGTTPLGFDCSGFTQYVYLRLGVQLPRRVIQQVRVGYQVLNPLPGDLLFFRDKGRLAHVGLFLGNNQMAHVSYSRRKVVVVELTNYWTRNLHQVRRVCPVEKCIPDRTDV